MKNKETALILINSLREEVRKRHTALKKIDEEMEILRKYGDKDFADAVNAANLEIYPSWDCFSWLDKVCQAIDARYD